MSFMVNPFRFAPTGPAGDVTIAVQDFNTGTATGTQSHTTTTLTGITPKAVMMVGCYHEITNDPGETPGHSRSIGMIDATAEGQQNNMNQDNISVTNNISRNQPSACMVLHNGAGSNTKVAGSGALVSGGFSANYSANTAPSSRSYFIAFAGADTSAKLLNTQSLGTGTAAIDIATVGFQPDVVIAMSACRSGTTSGANYEHSFGIAISVAGVVTQRCVIGAEVDAAADSAPFQVLRTDALAGQISTSTGALDYRVSASAFDSSGFSVTPSANAGSDLVTYLALKFGTRRVKLVDFTTPTSTGSSTITGAGFTPSFSLVVLTNLEALDSHPGATSDNQGGFSICSIGSDEQWAASWRTKSAAATTDTGGQISNVAIMGASATDCDAIKATFTAWTSDGVTVNYSAVQGTGKKGFVLFVE